MHRPLKTHTHTARSQVQLLLQKQNGPHQSWAYINRSNVKLVYHQKLSQLLQHDAATTNFNRGCRARSDIKTKESHFSYQNDEITHSQESLGNQVRRTNRKPCPNIYPETNRRKRGERARNDKPRGVLSRMIEIRHVPHPNPNHPYRVQNHGHTHHSNQGVHQLQNRLHATLDHGLAGCKRCRLARPWWSWSYLDPSKDVRAYLLVAKGWKKEEEGKQKKKCEKKRKIK